MESEPGTTLVIGLGETGRPLLGLIERSGARALGVDVDAVDVDGLVGLMHVCFPYDIPEGSSTLR